MDKQRALFQGLHYYGDRREIETRTSRLRQIVCRDEKRNELEKMANSNIRMMTLKGVAKMDTKLSAVLLSADFFPVLGTTERMGLGDGDTSVCLGTPFIWDANNGILVIYDERGWPWITLWRISPIDVYGLEKDFNLKRGAWVPHSNDAGAFVHTVVLPALNGGVK